MHGELVNETATQHSLLSEYKFNSDLKLQSNIGFKKVGFFYFFFVSFFAKMFKI